MDFHHDFPYQGKMWKVLRTRLIIGHLASAGKQKKETDTKKSKNVPYFFRRFCDSRNLTVNGILQSLPILVTILKALYRCTCTIYIPTVIKRTKFSDVSNNISPAAEIIFARALSKKSSKESKIIDLIPYDKIFSFDHFCLCNRTIFIPKDNTTIF